MAYRGTATITRPNDTTAYAAGDVVGDVQGGVIKLHGMPLNQDILITDVIYHVDVNAVPSGMTSFTMKLYNDRPASAIADNAAWDIPDGDRATYEESISLGSPADIGSRLSVEQHQVNQIVRTGPQGLYFYLVTAGGYTPSASAVKRVTVYAIPLL